MAFHEVQFPPAISYGAVGGPGFHTTIQTLASGFERRNVDWAEARATYDVAQGLKTQQELNALIDFFYARNGKAFGFRFKDWADYQAPFPGLSAQALGTTDGTTSVFQLVKTYGDTAATYNRTILKPVAGTFQLLNNGANSTDFTIDTTTGLVTLGATTTATTGHVLTCGFQFDVPVRFDTDDMKTTINEYNNFTWGQIPLVELKQGNIS